MIDCRKSRGDSKLECHGPPPRSEDRGPEKSVPVWADRDLIHSRNRCQCAKRERSAEPCLAGSPCVRLLCCRNRRESSSSPPRQRFDAVTSDHRQEVLRLLLEHRSSLFAFILAVTRRMETAEDVFQDVSLAICESAEAYELGTNFAAWSREIARRRIAASFRQDKRSQQLLALLESRGLEAGFARSDADDSAQQRVAALHDCLQGLGPFVRSLFELRYSARLRLEQIAGRVGRRPESVRKAIYRGRIALRKCIESRRPLEASPVERG